MKKFTHLGAYGLIIKNDEILLIKKNGGFYNNKLDLPGGTIEFEEKPEITLVRELEEEVGIKVTKYSLFDANSTVFEWEHKGEIERGHHIGIFYKVDGFKSEVKENVDITEQNDDSLGASFYKISDLRKSQLSNIAEMEIEKLGYILND